MLRHRGQRHRDDGRWSAHIRIRSHFPTRSSTSSRYEACGLPGQLPARSDVCRDKIFKGATAGDPPIKQPTKFDLVISLKSATTPGATDSSIAAGAGRSIDE